MKSKQKLNQYCYKASWRATALTFHVEAKDEDEAFLKAARYVNRMLGGKECLDLELKGMVDVKK